MKSGLKKLGLKLLLALSVTGNLRANEAEKNKAPEAFLLEACDEALEDQVALNKEQTALIEQLKISAIVKDEQIKALEKSSSAWYNNTTLMLFMGLTAGLIAGGVIAK